jgi:biotin carboxyl carrier protein
MDLPFGLLMTLIGVVSVFSSLAVVALVCVVLKRLFKGGVVEEAEVPPPKELELKGVEESGIGSFRIKLNGEEHEVKIEDLGTIGTGFEEVMPPSGVGEELRVAVGGVEYKVKVEKLEEIKAKIHSKVKEHVPAVKEVVKNVKEVVIAPMQGTVVKVSANVGDKVEKGSVVVVLETMKMENAIESMVSGIVKEVKVSEGDSVKGGDTLVIIG